MSKPRFEKDLDGQQLLDFMTDTSFSLEKAFTLDQYLSEMEVEEDDDE